MSNEANAASSSLQQRGSAGPRSLAIMKNFDVSIFSKSMGPYKYGQGVAALYSRTPLAIVRLKYTCPEFNLGSRDTLIKRRCC